MANEDLEKVIKEQINPIIDEAMQRYIGATIKELRKDITDKITTKPFFDFDIDPSMDFKTAKKLFKKYYLEKLLRTYYGEVSLVARICDIDRRTIHRMIKEFKIKVGKFRKSMLNPEYVKQKEVSSLIGTVLEDYKEVIHPDKIKKMYRKIPALSSEILKELQIEHMSMQEAEEIFEKEFITKALARHKNNITKTAKAIGLRYETLHRKIKKLKIVL